MLAGINFRTIFASLPPLLDDVRGALGLSATVAGLLTTGPVLCFGVFALLGPRLVRRFAIERVVTACLALTAAGAAARGVGGLAGLFTGTLLAGAAVAVGQAVVPTLVRSRFGGQAARLTGVFSMALTLGAAAAAATAVPLEHAFDGWRRALAAFALPAALGVAIWLAAASGRSTLLARGERLRLAGSRGSWAVAVYFGLQSMAFYAGLSWLPSILQDDGYSEAAAGGLQALANATQFAPAFLLPILAGRVRNQTALLVTLVAAGVAAFAGLLVAPGAALLWMVVIGVIQGGSLGLAMMLPILRSHDDHAVATLTAMTLSVGYLVASAGPSLVGLGHDLTGGWTLPLVLLMAITAAELIPGVPATRSWKIGGEVPARAVQ